MKQQIPADAVRLILGFPRSATKVDPMFQSLQSHWEAAGLDAVYVALDADDETAIVEREYLEAVQQDTRPGSLVLGGFSLGARIAAQIADAVQPLALLCFGYPFHLRSHPKQSPGLETLRRVQTPTLIVQGSRDAHGNREEVSGYGRLPSCVQLHWLEDGNHRFRPRLHSGHSLDGHLRSAAEAALKLISRSLESRTHA